MFENSAVLNILLTVSATIFVAELTDKDAFLILSLATQIEPWIVFGAGSVAFTITSAIIVTLGHFLIMYVPPSYVSLAGGTIMVGYGIWSYFHSSTDDHEAREVERKLSVKSAKGRTSVFLTAVGLLILLDLAGDATEVLTILFVARFGDVVLVFFGAVLALIAATGVETAIGNRLSKILSRNRIRTISLLLFLAVGASAILSVLFRV